MKWRDDLPVTTITFLQWTLFCTRGHRTGKPAKLAQISRKVTPKPDYASFALSAPSTPVTSKLLGAESQPVRKGAACYRFFTRPLPAIAPRPRLLPAINSRPRPLPAIAPRPRPLPAIASRPRPLPAINSRPRHWLHARYFVQSYKFLLYIPSPTL